VDVSGSTLMKRGKAPSSFEDYCEHRASGLSGVCGKKSRGGGKKRETAAEMILQKLTMTPQNVGIKGGPRGGECQSQPE